MEEEDISVDLGGKPLEIMPEMCKSCIFREDGNALSLNQGRLDEIQGYLITGTAHICHHAAVTGSGPMRACRGGRDFQLTIWSRLGLISEPTDEALAEAMQECGLEAPTPPKPGRRSKIH